ncbi:hypothetical protein RG47T_0989 [Mucilaginibacter polytrichastri]|uniref:Uncharacterized protein n=1 Tax=Mucilaginibacter polytrichastri TaxID=1302689 RepID=A0A1Q5ZUY7_9SPHI|nr:hypothetical protein RG47T_0989 [Mucilaginibacter polytrichastri]
MKKKEGTKILDFFSLKYCDNQSIITCKCTESYKKISTKKFNE